MSRLFELIRKHFKVTPRGIIEIPQLAPTHLPRNSPTRPFRSGTAYLYLGTHGQGRRAPPRSGRRRNGLGNNKERKLPARRATPTATRFGGPCCHPGPVIL